MMFRKRTKRVDLANALEAAFLSAQARMEEDEKRPRPNTIDEYLALSPTQRNGAYLQASLVTELCESVVALRAIQDKT